MRIGLKTFLIVAVVVAAVGGFYLQHFLRWDCMTSSGVTSSGSRYNYARFLDYGDLRYLAIRPASFDSGWAVGTSYSWSTSYLQLSPRGIYVGGKLVPMTARVFVYTVDRTMRPIPLTNEELGQVLVHGSPVWLKKIEPVIDEEYQRGLAGVADASTSL